MSQEDPIITQLKDLNKNLIELREALWALADKTKGTKAPSNTPQGSRGYTPPIGVKPRLSENKVDEFLANAVPMMSKFPGVCNLCGEAIGVGEPILYDKPYGAAHEECGYNAKEARS
jgi:hypothetical protein